MTIVIFFILFVALFIASTIGYAMGVSDGYKNGHAAGVEYQKLKAIEKLEPEGDRGNEKEKPTHYVA